MLPITSEQLLCIARQHAAAGRFSDAEQLYRRLLRDQPKSSELLHLLGTSILQAGRPAQAIPYLAKATELDQHQFQLHLDLARACSLDSQTDRAIDAYRTCTQIDPHRPEPHAELGILLGKSGNTAEAIQCLQHATHLAPESAEYHFHLAVALRAAGKTALAIESYRRSLALNPDSAEVHCNLGVALAESHDTAPAIACYERAIAINPAYFQAHFNLGNALRKTDEQSRAIQSYQRAIQHNPDFAQAFSNMGMSFGDLGKHDLAIAAYDRAAELRPDWAEPRWNRALTHLLLGNFQRGWAEFDCRNQIDPPSSREFPGDRWNGEDLAGKTILLHYEMGLGDTIQFARYVPLVAARGGRVILECQESLREILASIDGAAQVITLQPGQSILHYEKQCSLMRLPELFRSDPATIPAKIPYLKPSHARIEKWRTQMSARNNAMRVGLVWAGRPEHQNDRHRSISLASLAPLAAVPNLEFFSLQRGPAARQAANPPAGMNLIDLTPDFENMADTAAVIHQLDLVICVDTSVAHLAGALGKEVWLLLAYVPDWRWMLDRADTPWYPQMRLFRQTRRGHWATTIQQVAEQLRDLRSP